MAIVGEFTIGSIISDTPQKVWELTHKHGGITKNHFNDYFKGCKMAHAIEIDEVVKLDTSINPKDVIQGFTAPQNFLYLENDL